MAYAVHGDIWTPEVQARLRRSHELGIAGHKLTCQDCGAEFFAHSPAAKWCSAACSESGSRKRRRQRAVEARHRTCDACRQEFNCGRRDGRYCSPACRQREYRQRTARYGSSTESIGAFEGTK